MADESMELLQKRVYQAVGLIERLKEENTNLKSQIIRLEDEVQSLKEQINEMKSEREKAKSKVDEALSMLDALNIEDGEQDKAKAADAQ